MRGNFRPEQSELRFWANVQKTESCWIWTGYKQRLGYGRFRGRRPADGSMAPKVLAHRFSYELLVGPIPESIVLDHLCRNPSCVNPAHLDPTDQRTNIMRGLINGAMQRNECVNGHTYDAGNTRIDARGHRVCRSCQRNYQSAARRRREAGPCFVKRRDKQTDNGL